MESEKRPAQLRLGYKGVSSSVGMSTEYGKAALDLDKDRIKERPKVEKCTFWGTIKATVHHYSRSIPYWDEIQDFFNVHICLNFQKRPKDQTKQQCKRVITVVLLGLLANISLTAHV